MTVQQLQQEKFSLIKQARKAQIQKIALALDGQIQKNRSPEKLRGGASLERGAVRGLEEPSYEYAGRRASLPSVGGGTSRQAPSVGRDGSPAIISRPFSTTNKDGETALPAALRTYAMPIKYNDK